MQTRIKTQMLTRQVNQCHILGLIVAPSGDTKRDRDLVNGIAPVEGLPKETLYDFLKRRATELAHEIAGLQGEIEARKNELTHIESAKRQIDQSGFSDAVPFGRMEGVEAKGSAGNVAATPSAGGAGVTIDDIAEGIVSFSEGLARTSRSFREAGERRPFLQFENFTIKQLIVKALTDHFNNGATALELRDFIKNAYGRDVDRASLTPQMSRLRDEEVLEYLPRSEEGDGPGNRYIVSRAFTSISRRFPVGTEIVIPAGEAELNKLKRELEPRGLDDLIERRWIVQPSSGGFWKLKRERDPLDVARLILKSLWLDLHFRDNGANRDQIKESIRRSGIDLSEQQIADGVRLLHSRSLLKNKGGPQNWRLTVKALEGLGENRALIE